MGKSCMSSDLRNDVQRANGKGEVNLENDSNNKNDVLPSKYGCQILFQDTTLEQVKDPSLPTDAYLVYYKFQEKICLDLCRGGKRADIFDFTMTNMVKILFKKYHGVMVNVTLESGDINRLKRKSENNSQIVGKNFPTIFFLLRFFKIVSKNTKLLA